MVNIMCILTGLEIKDLAEYAGFTIQPLEDVTESEVMAQEFSISKCPSQGVMNDNGILYHYNYIVQCDGCDDTECSPLGHPNN